MSTKRVQLTNLDRKVICELAIEHKALTQEELTALIRNKLEKPELARTTVTGVLKSSDKWLAVPAESAGCVCG